jgi:predicted double-glycine peptidase
MNKCSAYMCEIEKSSTKKMMIHVIDEKMMILLGLFGVATAATKMLKVPYFRQENEYACGAASLQMVLGYFNRFPTQSAIESVARTNPDEGTWSFGLMRGLAQSARSGSELTTFGLAPVRRDVNVSSGLSWNLIQLIDADIPVIVLQHFDPDIEDGDGHYRVAVGHSNDSIFLLDPWDRDGQPHLISMNRSMFDLAWSIDESTDFAASRRRRSLPSSRFVGVFVAPLELNIVTRVNAGNYSADIYAHASYGTAVNRYGGGARIPALREAQMSLWLPDSSVMTLQPLTMQLPGDWSGRDSFRCKWSVGFLDRNQTFVAQKAGFSVSVSGDVKLRMIATKTSGEFAYVDTIGTTWGPTSL